MGLSVGQPAPEFSLTNYDGRPYSLSGILADGPAVLIFYPLDQSPRCTKLMCSVNDEVAMYRGAGLQVVGINWADGESHRAFAANKRLSMPLLSDPSYSVSAAYDALYRIGPFKFIRYTIVGVAQDGAVKFYQHGTPDNAAVIAGMTAA